MKVQAKQIECYELILADGIVLSHCFVEDQWEGMVKLSTNKGIVIIDKPNEWGIWFESMFAGNEPSMQECSVIKASPDIINLLTKNEKS